MELLPVPEEQVEYREYGSASAPRLRTTSVSTAASGSNAQWARVGHLWPLALRRRPAAQHRRRGLRARPRHGRPIAYSELGHGSVCVTDGHGIRWRSYVRRDCPTRRTASSRRARSSTAPRSPPRGRSSRPQLRTASASTPLVLQVRRDRLPRLRRRRRRQLFSRQEGVAKRMGITTLAAVLVTSVPPRRRWAVASVANGTGARG